MKIIETPGYKRTYKILLKNHLVKEVETLDGLMTIIYQKETFKDVLNCEAKSIYKITKKVGNLKKIYTANLNNKIRLHMKPVGDYPYNLCEIEELEFIKIDDKHYGDG